MNTKVEEINELLKNRRLNYLVVQKFDGNDLILAGGLEFIGPFDIEICFKSVYYLSLYSATSIDCEKKTIEILKDDENRIFNAKHDILKGIINFKINIDTFHHRVEEGTNFLYISAEEISYKIV